MNNNNDVKNVEKIDANLTFEQRIKKCADLRTTQNRLRNKIAWIMEHNVFHEIYNITGRKLK